MRSRAFETLRQRERRDSNAGASSLSTASRSPARPKREQQTTIQRKLSNKFKWHAAISCLAPLHFPTTPTAVHGVQISMSFNELAAGAKFVSNSYFGAESGAPAGKEEVEEEAISISGDKPREATERYFPHEVSLPHKAVPEFVRRPQARSRARMS